MIGMGPYSGDGKVEELLSIYQPSLTFAELRAAMTGVILAVENVPPSHVFNHLFGDENERSTFTDQNEARDWFSCMMGLWNELTKFQEAKNPFLFSDWPEKNQWEAKDIIQIAKAREKEIEQFVWGLHAGNTPFADDFEDPKAETLLSWTPSLVEAALQVMKRAREELETGKAKDCLVLASLHFALNNLMRKNHAEFVTGIKDLRVQWLGDLKESSAFARSEPKVGRNDPCPCGSSKKFKRCCLQ